MTRNVALAALVLLLLATVPGWADRRSSALAASYTGDAFVSGTFGLAHREPVFLDDEPAQLNIEYSTTGPTYLSISFQFMDYAMGAYGVGVIDMDGAISWSGSALEFYAVSTDVQDYVSYFDVTFPDAGAVLTPGVLPQSLAPLVGYGARFNGLGGDYSEGPKDFDGYVNGIVPEPSSIVTLAIGLLGLGATRILRSRRRDVS